MPCCDRWYCSQRASLNCYIRRLHITHTPKGVACISHGISAQDKIPGRNKGGGSRGGRDGGGRNRSDRMGMDDLIESDESVSDDAMDVDNHIVNPNEY